MSKEKELSNSARHQRQIAELQRELKQKDQSLALIEAAMERNDQVYRAALTKLGDQKKKLSQQNFELAQTRKAILKQNSKLADFRLELVEKNRMLAEASTTDPLTKILNRRRTTELFNSEILRRQRYGGYLSAIMLDIDHFKRLNDTHGHAEGDNVLIRTTRVITNSLRATDIFGRWGGEEFLILCPNTPASGAATLAEKLRHTIEQDEQLKRLKVTSSFGIADWHKEDDMESLLAKADGALYQAKETRNTVRVFGAE